MKIELTTQEANSLAEIINIAVKAEGLKLAGNGLYFVKKIEEAMKQEPKQELPKQEQPTNLDE